MKLFVTGANSPTGKHLVELLRQRRVSFLAPARHHFFPENAMNIAKMVTEYGPSQLINLTDFISGNHNALRRAERFEHRCRDVNTLLPATLAEICHHLQVPMLHLSNAYVFDGDKKLGYNENDEPKPMGVYGLATLEGEKAVAEHDAHTIIRSGWLFGKWKKGLIKSWIRQAHRNSGQLLLSRRRFSPTHTGDLAAAILAVCQQIDCEANAWGVYHYSGLETKREIEFVQQTLKYAASHDENIYQLLDSLTLVEKDVRPPEIHNSTLSSKKIFDTFGIKQKSWHGDLQDVIKTVYEGRNQVSTQSRARAGDESAASSVA